MDMRTKENSSVIATAKTWVQLVLVTLLLVTTAVPAAHAALERVGPVDIANGAYPAWYQDNTGVALEFCSSIGVGPGAQAELNGGWCLILPADVPTGSTPEVPFTNYSGEHFYWNATAGSSQVQGGTILILGLEAAFTGTTARAGDQVTFGRVRIKIANVLHDGDYKVYTPFADFDFPGLSQGDRLFETSDVGIACGTGYACALNSLIGPFLLPSNVSGGAELPPVTATNPDPGGLGVLATPYPGTGKSYIADPARLGPVTGSPLPPFVSAVDGATYDHNRFRIEYTPPGGVPTLYLDEPNFTMAGRVMTNTIPGKVTVTRASYEQTAVSSQLDVFAQAFQTTQGRIPAAPLAASLSPNLGFYDAACTTDPTTGVVTGPPTGPGIVYYQMYTTPNALLRGLPVSDWWGAIPPLVIPAPALPSQVCVVDFNAKNASGVVTPAYFLHSVTDEVFITQAFWDPAILGGTLTVNAASSDQLTLPTLTVSGLGAIDPLTGTFTVSDLGGPPPKVTVVSTRGGSAVLDVRTGIGIPVSPNVPMANADSVPTSEDVAASNINVLANDTLNGLLIVAADGATVAISNQPRLGAVIVNADQSITYTPSLNLNGTDIVGYTVTVGAFTSGEGYLTINIAPVNDAPVANNDSTGAPNNKAVTINVLANDTDVDGQADLASAVIQTLPPATTTLKCNGGVAAVVGTVCAGGLIDVTPTVQGVTSFTYKARDVAGLDSLNSANVSVTANAVENIVVSKSTFTSRSLRWVVSGTDNSPSGQTVTVKYDIPVAPAAPITYKVGGVCTTFTAANNIVIGTAVVDAFGAWAVDKAVSSAGFINPTNTGSNSNGFWCSAPKAVRVTSPLGGNTPSNIGFK